MKDVQAYIETGILELYVLGDVTPDEKLQVEEMIATHPIVKIEVDEIERAMEGFASANAIEPSENQQQRILNSILTNFGDDRTFKSKPAVDNVIVMQTPKANNFYKYAFAASLALLVGTAITLYNVYNRLQQSNVQLIALASQNQQIAKTVNLKEQQLGVFRDTTFKFIRLKGTPKAPQAAMAIAWNPVNKKVMIDMASMKMPKNDEQHQYQLWAIVGGKPVDLGVFDKAAADTTDMIEMKSIAMAQAFAVTLEPKGGSPSPHMDEMMAIKML